jgi:hypothetical protein
MKHTDPRGFGKADRAGWYLRAQMEHRAAARKAANTCAAVAAIASIAVGICAAFGEVGPAILFGIAAAVALVVAVAAASEA